MSKRHHDLFKKFQFGTRDDDVLFATNRMFPVSSCRAASSACCIRI
jgi:hypothetical protein